MVNQGTSSENPSLKLHILHIPYARLLDKATKCEHVYSPLCFGERGSRGLQLLRKHARSFHSKWNGVTSFAWPRQVSLGHTCRLLRALIQRRRKALPKGVHR